MRTAMTSIGQGSPAVLDHPQHDHGAQALGLEALPPGRRFAARDGRRFIRTNLICFGFCDLATGQLCSARDICTKHGGMCATRAQCHEASRMTESNTTPALARHV